MRRRHVYANPKPEMTPMIDVTFLLLIFFIVTLNFRTLEGRLDSAMPRRGGEPSPLEETLKIDIVMRVLVEGERVPDAEAPRYERYAGRKLGYQIGARRFDDLVALRGWLSDEAKDTPVSIDARDGTIYEDVIALLDVVIAEGFEEIAFAGAHH